jgi:hypothetical protein
MAKYSKVCKRKHIIYDEAGFNNLSTEKDKYHILSLQQQKLERTHIIEMLKTELMIYEDSEGCATSFRWNDPLWIGYRKHIKDFIIKLNGK